MSAVDLPVAPVVATYHSKLLANYSLAQLASLQRMYELAKRNQGTSGGNTAAKLLLGLYNGTRFPFDLTDLRLLDNGNLMSAMTVILMDAVRTHAEVHVVLDAIYNDRFSTGNELESWAFNLRLKGRCKKEYIQPERIRRLA